MTGENIKKPEDIEADTREEMRCPNCGEKTVVEHPSAKKLSSKREKILYGSTCSNTNCELHKKRIEAERLKPQYSGSLFEVLQGRFTKKNIKSILIVIGFIALSYYFFTAILLGGGGSSVQVSGTVVDYNGNPVENAKVVFKNEGIFKTNESGYFSGKIDSEKVKFYIVPPEESKILGATRVLNATIKNKSLYISNNKTTEIELPKAYVFEAKGKGVDISTELSFKSKINANGTILKLRSSNTGGKTSQRKVFFNKTGTRAIVNGNVIEENITVSVPVKRKQINETLNYQEPINIGNGRNKNKFTNAQIDIKNKINKSEVRTEVKRVRNKETFNINIQSNSKQDVIATLSQGSSKKVKTNTGIWKGKDPVINIAEINSPVTTTVKLSGKINTRKRKDTGIIKNGEINVNIKGNIRAKKAKITFKGGENKTTRINSEEISASGKTGNEYKEINLSTIRKDGKYILETIYEIEKNEEYVDAGYIINGNKKNISKGEKTKELDLRKGDIVKLWIRAETQSTQNEKVGQKDDTNIIIKSYTVNPKEADVGESVKIKAKLTNPTEKSDSIEIKTYIDGELKIEKTYSVNPGKTKNVTIGNALFDEKGVHSISINGKKQKIIKVGGVEIEYGEGKISGTLKKKSEGGIVNIDTNGDGIYDCSVKAIGGECNIGTLLPKKQSIEAEQQGVRNTEWKLEYISRRSPKNVKIDVDGDGNYEKQNNNLKNKTITVTEQLKAGKHKIDIEGNGGTIEYTINRSIQGKIRKPEIFIDGVLQTQSGRVYDGKKEINLGALTPGKHNITFKSPIGAYSASLKWTETNKKIYPPVKINGNVICTSQEIKQQNGKCRISETNKDGKINLNDYKGNITVKYTKIIIPNKIRIRNNGETALIIKTNQKGEIKQNKWVYNTNKSQILLKGANNLFVNPRGRAKINYTTSKKKNAIPNVSITRNNKTTNYTIKDEKLGENGQIVKPITLKIGKYLGSGKNVVRVKSTNNIPIVAIIEGKTTKEQNVTFGPT